MGTWLQLVAALNIKRERSGNGSAGALSRCSSHVFLGLWRRACTKINHPSLDPSLIAQYATLGALT